MVSQVSNAFVKLKKTLISSFQDELQASKHIDAAINIQKQHSIVEKYRQSGAVENNYNGNASWSSNETYDGNASWSSSDSNDSNDDDDDASVSSVATSKSMSARNLNRRSRRQRREQLLEKAAFESREQWKEGLNVF